MLGSKTKPSVFFLVIVNVKMEPVFLMQSAFIGFYVLSICILGAFEDYPDSNVEDENVYNKPEDEDASNDEKN